jgi:hypothetical protein
MCCSKKKGGGHSGVSGVAVPAFRGAMPPAKIPVTLSPFIWDPTTDGSASVPSRIDSVLSRTLSFGVEDTLLSVLVSGARAMFLIDALDWQDNEASGGLTQDGVWLYLGLLSKVGGFQSVTSVWNTQGKLITLGQFRVDVNAKKNSEFPLAILLKRDVNVDIQTTETTASSQRWSSIVTSGRFSYTPSQSKGLLKVRCIPFVIRQCAHNTISTPMYAVWVGFQRPAASPLVARNPKQHQGASASMPLQAQSAPADLTVTGNFPPAMGMPLPQHPASAVPWQSVRRGESLYPVHVVMRMLVTLQALVFYLKDGSWSTVGSEYPPSHAHVRIIDQTPWDHGSFRDVYRADFKADTAATAVKAVVRDTTTSSSLDKFQFYCSIFILLLSLCSFGAAPALAASFSPFLLSLSSCTLSSCSLSARTHSGRALSARTLSGRTLSDRVRLACAPSAQALSARAHNACTYRF